MTQATRKFHEIFAFVMHKWLCAVGTLIARSSSILVQELAWSDDLQKTRVVTICL